MSSETHLESVQKGFELIALAATFLAGVQAQVMTITITIPAENQTTVISLINASFLVGLVLDIMAACLSFLTFRWLGRLTADEKTFLNDQFEERDKYLAEKSKGGSHQPAIKNPYGKVSLFERMVASWSSLSLFIPLFLIISGVGFMALGIQMYIWTLQPLLVAILVTIAYAAVIPFLVGLFGIGREPDRRKRIMHNLAMGRGDW